MTQQHTIDLPDPGEGYEWKHLSSVTSPGMHDSDELRTVTQFTRVLTYKHAHLFKSGWIAMDEDGEWFWHGSEPSFSTYTSCWCSSSELTSLKGLDPAFLPIVADWEESKTKVG